MKIRTNLLLLSTTFVILITLTGFIMFNTFGLINREIQESNRASRMIKDLSELDIVTYEYLMHHETRMQQQWLAKYESLSKLLDEMRKEELHPESLSIIESMTADYKLFGALFSQLRANFAKRKILIEENKSQTKINLSVAVEERLIAEVLMRSHDIAANAFKLSAVLEHEVAQTQQRSNLIIIFSIIGFAIFSSYISFLTIRAITKPINKLIKGAEIIGTGDLEHKIDLRTKNEMGQLGNSFNKMTKDLKEITVSKDKLDREVTERKKAEKRIEHLNLTLLAIRNVNQLIVRERDRDRLIQDACRNFIKNRGFYSAWIVLVDESRRLVTAAEAGLGKAFQPLLKNLKQDNQPNCVRRALAKPGILTIKDPASTCGDCPLANINKERGVFSSRLERDGKIYGILTISLPVDYFSEKEERSLFEEVVGDIAYALHYIELEEEHKKADNQIRASLKEKEVLLQEVHHRVKNNMQLISSLFSLQSGRIKDKQASEIFKSSQNRVRSMAIIHERLYQSKDFTRVDFAEYAQSLVTHLFGSYGINANVIKFYINIKNVFLDINTAIPCSLIINELVSNSLKHAFPAGKKGEIKIAMHHLNKDGMEVIVSDNGVGLPKKVDFRKTDSLGLHLVNLLAEDQLHGDIKLDRKKGTSFHIRFKVKR